MKFPRDTIQVTDGEWASSDKVVLACSDHCIRVYEMNLVDSSSSLEFQTIERTFIVDNEIVNICSTVFDKLNLFLEKTLLPYFMLARNANLLKHLLCINNGTLDELVKKCEDTNLNGLLEKELSKLDP